MIIGDHGCISMSQCAKIGLALPGGPCRVGRNDGGSFFDV